MDSRCDELVRLLESSVSRNRCDALLLSGGLDSSILASILRPPYAVTCSLGSSSPDVSYAKQVAERFCGTMAHEQITAEMMLGLVEKIVQIFKTFDPIEIRNSVVALAGIERAKRDGHNEVMTGDGGDELFAGYNYLLQYYSDPARLDSEIQRLWKVMHFSSQRIGEEAGVRVRAPYLDPEFMEFAKALPVQEKVGEYQGARWGKLILRRCYSNALGSELAWRPKLAQEQGAGTDRFAEYINERIDDLSFSNKSKVALGEGVTLRNKEHLHYYAIYTSHFPPPQEEAGEFRCPGCHACVEPDGRFCRTCGAFPISPAKSL